MLPSTMMLYSPTTWLDSLSTQDLFRITHSNSVWLTISPQELLDLMPLGPSQFSSRSMWPILTTESTRLPSLPSEFLLVSTSTHQTVLLSSTTQPLFLPSSPSEERSLLISEPPPQVNLWFSFLMEPRLQWANALPDRLQFSSLVMTQLWPSLSTRTDLDVPLFYDSKTHFYPFISLFNFPFS